MEWSALEIIEAGLIGLIKIRDAAVLRDYSKVVVNAHLK